MADPSGTPPIYGPEQFQAEFGVCDQVLQQLVSYAGLLTKWQGHINLVGRGSLGDLWQRHMRDSAQLIEHIDPSAAPWLDIGSGAGFPGLVLAILLRAELGAPVILVESDQRKAVFLSEVIRETRAAARVIAQRVEHLGSDELGGPARIITARALASVHQILDLTAHIATKESIYLLLKGQDVADELTLAAKYRKMTVSQHQSRTNSASKVLRITEVARV